MNDYLKTHRVAIILTVTILVAAIAVIVTSVRTSRLVVPTNQVNVRTGPGLSYRTTTELKKGDVIYVVNRKDNWYRVRYSDHHFGWVASWLVNTTSHLKTATNLSEATIVLDPGHGGSDSGALTSDQQHQEKTETLALAKKVQQALQRKGAHVLMTRTGDQNVSLGARPELATDNHADAFISFHFDSSPTNNSATGFTTYYYHKTTSLSLAQPLNRALDGLPLPNRGVAVGNYEVIRDNLRPAVLLEMGYINTDSNFKLIKTPSYQQAVADRVTKGLASYFKD